MEQEDKFTGAMKVILISTVGIAGATGIYQAWKVQDEKKREAAQQAAKDSLVLELAADPTIEYGEEIADPEALAMSYVTDTSGDVTVANADSIDSMKIGTVNLTYTVSTHDTYGVEVSESKDLTVTVKDTKAPEITLASDTVNIQEGSDFDPLANVTEVKDPVDGDLDKAKITVDNTVNTAEPGDYTVKVEAADNNGNTTDVSYAVTVTPKPVVKKTTTAAVSSSSSSNNSYAATGGQYSTDSTATAADTSSDQYVADSTSDSSTASNGGGSGNLDFDFYSFESSMKDLYNKGMEHYGEGVAWDAGMTSDGTVFWGQDW